MKARRIWLSASLLSVFLFSAPLLLLADSGPEHQALSRPLRLGTSGGNIYDRSTAWCCSGTLGALAKGVDGKSYILSNNHVLARTNAGNQGDPIIQPGLIDEAPVCTQDTGDAVATLTSWVPIAFKKGTTNHVDSAIAEVTTAEVDGRILDISSIGAARRGALNDNVQKSGRTTGLTTGTIKAINVSVSVKYGSTCGGGRGTGSFTDQMRITPATFSDGGDSGSLVLTSGGNPVGLLFAGSSTSTFANQIDRVLAAFSITIPQYAAATSWRSWFSWLLPRPRPAYAQGELPVSPGSEAAAHRAKARHEHALMAIQGVVGVGVGVSDSDARQAVVEVYVEHDSQRLRASIPAHVDNVPVKVVETGEIVARVSCAHPRE